MADTGASRGGDESWPSWVGAPIAATNRFGQFGGRLASVAALALLWLTAAVLVMSGFSATLVGEDEVPVWQLVCLVVLALGTVGLAVVLSERGRLIGIAAIFGSVLAIPWFLAGISRETVASDGALNLVIALVVVAIVSASGVASPYLLRLSVLTILIFVVWAALLMGVADLLGADIGAFHFANQRELFGVAQLRGFMGHPNTLALTASCAAVLSLQFTRSAARSGRTPVAISAALLGPVAAVFVVIMAQSKIGIAALLIGLSLVLLPLRGPGGRVWSWVLIGVLYAASFGPPLLASVTAMTFNGRATAWEIAADVFWESPVLGAGPDAFVDLPLWLTLDWVPGHAHNQVLQSASHAGLVGLVLLGISAVVAARIAIRSRGFDHLWSIGMMGVFGTFAMLEPVLGVSAVPITYLPVVLLSCVLGTAYTLDGSSERVMTARGSLAVKV